MRSAFLFFVAIVSIIYGIGLVLTPAWVNEMHGVASSPGTSLASRYFGTTLLGVGVMGWFNRNAGDSEALLAFMRGGLLLAAIGLIVSLHAMMSGLMNIVGWVPVIIQGLLTIGFAYFALMRSSPS